MDRTLQNKSVVEKKLEYVIPRSNYCQYYLYCE